MFTWTQCPCVVALKFTEKIPHLLFFLSPPLFPLFPPLFLLFLLSPLFHQLLFPPFSLFPLPFFPFPFPPSPLSSDPFPLFSLPLSSFPLPPLLPSPLLFPPFPLIPSPLLLIPTAPSGFDQAVILARGPRHLFLSWDPPAAANGILTNYTVLQDGVTLATLSPSVLEYNVSSLLPFTQYSFSVAVCNSAGCVESSSVTTMTLEDGTYQPHSQNRTNTWE